MSTNVLKKGAPSRSYPSRQRKLGPAPFASFEDLSDELESPGGPPPAPPPDQLPGLVEEPGERDGPGTGPGTPHKAVTATSSGSNSFPQSGIQTPSTPRIDISCASSTSTDSSSSESESKELFQGGLGLAFQEEGAQELKSSTEELDPGQGLDDLDSEEEKRRKREIKEREELYRRSSHPANLFRRKSEMTMGLQSPEVEHRGEYSRKPSAHTLFLDGLLTRPTHGRHGSFGSADKDNYCFMRPGAVSSMSARSAGSLRGKPGGLLSRSPSPHKMMLETSFCGSKPIPTKSMEMESPPKSEEDKKPPGEVVLTKSPTRIPSSPAKTPERSRPPLTPTKTPEPLAKPPIAAKPPSLRIRQPTVDIENKKPQPEVEIDKPRATPTKEVRSLSIKSLGTPHSPGTTTPSPEGSRRPSATSASGRRSVSPFKMVYETSFCGSKPIPTRSMETDSPPREADITALLIKAQVHASPSQTQNQQNPPPPSAGGSRSRSGSPPNKGSDHWRPITPKSPRAEGGGGSEVSSPSLSQSTAKYVSTPIPGRNCKIGKEEKEQKEEATNVFKWPETKNAVPPSPSPDEITNELRFHEGPTSQIPLDSASSVISSANTTTAPPSHNPNPVATTLEEAEFLQHDSDNDDGDLPYVPTTLPQERSFSQGVLVFPSRSGSIHSETMIPLQRPKVVRPPNPASINDYIAHATMTTRVTSSTVDKMTVKLPRQGTLGGVVGIGGAIEQRETPPGTGEAVNSPVSKTFKGRQGSIGATNWADFAEMGLRSPREIRKKLRDESVDE